MPRSDGRAPDEIRPVRFDPGYLKWADGSVLIEVGDTRLVCSASVEERVPRWRKGKGLGWVTAEYQMIPRATEVRTPRESSRGRPSGRSQEIQRLIGRSMRAVVNMSGLGERTIWLDCDVIQADGGTRTAAVTGAYVALALALKGCMEARKIGRLPLVDLVAATSMGIVGEEVLLDLAYGEDSAASVDMNVVMTGAGRLVEVQGTAEEAPFSREQLDSMLTLAEKGIRGLIGEQREVLGSLVAGLPLSGQGGG